MIKNIFAVVLSTLLLTGCYSIKPDLSIADRIFADYLNTKPDGYVGTLTSTGEIFKIESTKISSSSAKLCRIVSAGKDGSFKVTTYCKVKGGNWK